MLLIVIQKERKKSNKFKSKQLTEKTDFVTDFPERERIREREEKQLLTTKILIYI